MKKYGLKLKILLDQQKIKFIKRLLFKKKKIIKIIMMANI